MSSRARPLPNIPVKHTTVRKVIQLAPPLEAKLHAYIVYYTVRNGIDPKCSPTECDTIVAILDSFLSSDREFARHLREVQTKKVGETDK